MASVGHCAVRTFIVDHNARVLLLKRASGRKFAGQKEPPGGKVEAHEDIISAARREILEESGYLVSTDELSYVGCNYFEAREGGIGAEFFFSTRQKIKRVKLSKSEHESFEWKTIDSLERNSMKPEVYKFLVQHLSDIVCPI
jgi:8-oxo-dGTP pyrophosphatase MutT (NUDIX family)